MLGVLILVREKINGEWGGEGLTKDNSRQRQFGSHRDSAVAFPHWE